MDCKLATQSLIAYHFAVAGDDERTATEAHLVACTDCLRTYLALKAHVDRGAREKDQPSEAARLRLRAAVASRFRPSPAKRVGRFLSRPVPLYQGLAAAALVALAVSVLPALARERTAPLTAHFVERVDTARPDAQSLTTY